MINRINNTARNTQMKISFIVQTMGIIRTQTIKDRNIIVRIKKVLYS